MTKLIDLLSPNAQELLYANGAELLETIGIDVVKAVVLDILVGKNLRTSTEILTRSRIAALNLATVNLFFTGKHSIENFIERLPDLAVDNLQRKRLSKEEKWVAQWVLGLTDKGVQNILRDNPGALRDYRDAYVEACQKIVQEHEREYGQLIGRFKTLNGQAEIEISWLFMVYLLTTIGAQTLTIRGSDKSTYGKLFEKLVLGSLLEILGFRRVFPGTIGHQVYWLSSAESHRESDATLIYAPGKGVRFDIGFIGRGNTEISLDKVTRFQSQIEYGTVLHYMATFIIVDRIGPNSRLPQLAQEIGGTIVQMSANYWTRRVARILHETLGFEHPLINADDETIEDLLKEKLAHINLRGFLTGI